MGKPACSVFLCDGYGFAFKKPDGETVLYCDDHAEQLGFSGTGKSCDDHVEIKEAEAVENAVLDVLKDLPPVYRPQPKPVTPEPKGIEMPNPQPIKRLDTNEVFPDAEAAGKSAGCSSASVYLAMKENRPLRNGVKFERVSGEIAPAAKPTPKPTPTLATVKAKAPDAVTRRMEVENTPTVSTVFAALASMAAGLRAVKLTDIEVTTGNITIKIATLELTGA